MTRLHSITVSAVLVPAVAALLVPTRAACEEAQEPTTEISLVGMSHAAGVLEPGGKEVRQTFAVDSAGDLAFVVASPARLDVEVALPDGRTVSAAKQDHETSEVFSFRLDAAPAGVPLPGLGRGEHTLVRLQRAPAGPYELRLSALDAPEPVPFAVTMLPSSTLRLGIVLPETEIPTGQAVAISALLFDEERPVGEASVVASVSSPPEKPDGPASPAMELELRDDGALPDAAAGDGIFSGLFTPRAAGAYTVLVRARGRAATGLPFERDTAGALTVRDRRVQLGERYESATVDADENGIADGLLSRSTAAIDHAGLYDLAVTLRAENGRTVSAHTLSSLEAGEQTVDVVFGAAGLRSLGVDGPYALAVVRLDQVGEAGAELADRQLEAGSTVPVSLERLQTTEGLR